MTCHLLLLPSCLLLERIQVYRELSLILDSRLQSEFSLSLDQRCFCYFGWLKCECLLALDLKDAHHTIKLTDSSQPCCGILPYFGSVSYGYHRMPMD